MGGRYRAGASGNNGDAIRLRFLSEAEFQALWNAGGISIDGDAGAATTTDPEAMTEQVIYPIVIEIHWSDAGGDRVYQLAAVLYAQAQLDR